MAGPGLIDEVKTKFLALPPISRVLIGSSIATPIILKLIPASFLYLSLLSIETQSINFLQPWRLATNFFISELSMNLIFHVYFVYQYSTQVEIGVFDNRTSDYFVFITFCGLACDLLGWMCTLYALPGALMMCIIYLWSQVNSENTVSFMFGFQFKAKFLPWVLLGFESLQKQGSFPIDTFIGILVGHLYYFIDRVYPGMNGGVKIIQTPAFLKELIPDAVPEGAVNTGSADKGASSKPKWGKGHKLGT